MSGDRLEVNVTFGSARGYIASAPELRQPIVALSLASLRKRIEIALLPDNVVLQLDGLAGRKRDRRRAQAHLSRIAQLDQRTTLSDQYLHSAEADMRPPRRKSGFDPTSDIAGARLSQARTADARGYELMSIFFGTISGASEVHSAPQSLQVQ